MISDRMKKIIYKVIPFLWDDRFKFEPDLEISRKLMMLNYVVIACFIFLVPIGVLSAAQGNYVVGFFDLLSAVIIASLSYYYKKTLNYLFLSYTLVVVLGVLFLFLLMTSGVDHSGSLWSYIFPVSVMFLLGRKTGRLFTTAYLIIAVVMLTVFVSPELYTLNFKLRFISSFVAASVISYYVEFVREKMHALLQEKNSDLEQSLYKLEKQEKTLTENELFYRTLFEASNDALFIMDGDTFTECNSKTLEMFGCKLEEIKNHSPIMFSPKFQPDGSLSSEKALEKINSALSGKSQFFEWVHCKLDGTNFYAEVSLDIIELDNKKLVQASVRDITNRKIAEEELRVAKEYAEKSDRLKSDFLAQMSHEIRTPINTIMNYTSLLKMEFENEVSEINAGSFTSIENAAHRLLRTIDLVLNISDLEAGTYDPHFEKNDLIEHIIIPVVNEFKQAAKNKNLSLKVSEGKIDGAITVIDNYTVYQTIANLVDNAIKYTETGEIIVSLESKDENYIIKIKDTGLGISKEYIPNLFDKFSQEETGYTRRYEGSGLGLALVKNYSKINGINISVESEKGSGTTFILEIPIVTTVLGDITEKEVYNDKSVG
jgi:PAS domain S-box-containing protein